MTGIAKLHRGSTILTLIPHFNCEPYLADCLDSIMNQSRKPQGIVVINDGPENIPQSIVEDFPEVTLLAAIENVGPYRLVQTVIENTGYDGYMFQDADDWSAPERLELQLLAAERTGAELIGSQGTRIISNYGEAATITYPLDVNSTYQYRPAAYPILHPTSLASRDLIMRIGGFSSGMRFSGDTEFQRRSSYVSRIINVPQFVAFKRDRGDSLTGSEETGLRSRIRIEVNGILRDRALDNAIRVRGGNEPDLVPYLVAGPVDLLHVCGPKLLGQSNNTWPS